MPCAIVDLDGTLADTSQDIYESLVETLGKFGLPTPSFNTVLGYIGDGVKPLVEKILRDEKAEEKLDEVLKSFIDLYFSRISLKTKLHFPLIEFIQKIKMKNISCILVTNKSWALTLKLLTELCVLHIFDGIVTGDFFDEKKPSPQIVKKAEKLFGVSEPYLIIGDGFADCMLWYNLKKTGKKAHLAFVRWGFLPDKVKSRFYESTGLSPEFEVEEANELFEISKTVFRI